MAAQVIPNHLHILSAMQQETQQQQHYQGDNISVSLYPNKCHVVTRAKPIHIAAEHLLKYE